MQVKIKTIYADEHERGTLLCDQCGKIKIVTISDLKNIGRALKVKCGCGHIFFIKVGPRS